MSINLVERIGIDRSALFDFLIQEVDTEKIENHAKQGKNGKSYTKIVYDDNSPIELPNGKRVGKLVIKDQYIGKLTVKCQLTIFKSFIILFLFLKGSFG